MENELVEKHDEKHQQIVAPLVQQLLALGDLDSEKLNNIMALQERYDANEAKKQYNGAMAQFRSTVGMAKKSGENKHLRTRYATLDDLIEALQGPLSAAGFNFRFNHTFKDDRTEVDVTCYLTHAAGHTEQTSFPVPIDGHKGINNIQARGMAITYGKRYSLSSLTGVGTEDDDGQSSESALEIEYLTMVDYMSLLDIVDASGGSREKFEGWLSVKYKLRLEDNQFDYPAIPKSDIESLRKSIAAAAKKKEAEA